MRRDRQTKGPASLWNRLTTGGAALSMVAGLAGLTAAFTYPTEVYAQDNSGSKARVNLSARLRSLSEDTAASTCRVQAGISSNESLVHLKLVRDTFDTILSGLENGDKRLGIPTAEERGSLLKKIGEIHALWNPMRSAIDNMLAGTAAPSDYDVVASSFRELLLETERFAAAVSGAYSDPTSLLQSDAVTLNFLGRQRSLATRVARTTCGIYAENSEIGTADEFTQTSSVFDQSFQALISGFPAAGVVPPPSDAVKTVLQEVYDDWKVQEIELLAKMDAPATLSDAVSHAATFSQDAVQQVNNAITLYLIASPGQEDVFKAALEQYAQEQLLEWLEDPQVISSLKEQNATHANLTQDDVDALDLEWRAEAKGGDGTLISDTLAKPLSVWLQDKQTATAGIVTEVFIMDNKGLNVGQSAQTSDYWQGDEAKWKETFGKSEATMHVGDLEFDESSRSYQTQASQLIVDPQSGEPLGAVTFGINVINLM